MKDWMKIKVALCTCLYVSWWGLLYPELLVTPDTCRVVCEEDAEEEVLAEAQQLSPEELYQTLLEADRQQIRYRSRLLELLRELLEKRQE